MSAATNLLSFTHLSLPWIRQQVCLRQVYYGNLQRFHDVSTPIVSFYEQYSVQNFISFVF